MATTKLSQVFATTMHGEDGGATGHTYRGRPICFACGGSGRARKGR